MQVLVWLAAAAAVVRAAVVPSPPGPRALEIAGPLTVATCRANCLEKFADGREATCLQDPDCFTCWKKCELLLTNYDNASADCKNAKVCFPGCQMACRFHNEAPAEGRRLVATSDRVDQVLKLNTLPLGAGVLSWPPLPAHNLVYVLIARTASSRWRPISQSVESEVRLEAENPALEPDSVIRVMAVGPRGLIATMTLNPAQRPTLHRPSHKQAASKQPWRLWEVSLQHQGNVAVVDIAWEPRARNAWYLLTWELSGGGIKGNLLIDAPNVTLTLWPDTIYYVQVELVSVDEPEELRSAGVERTEMLALDTSVVTPVLESAGAMSRSERRRRQLTKEMLAGTGAAMLLFLLVAVAWRCRHLLARGPRKRRSLLADHSISAASTNPIVTVMTPKDCCEEPAQPPSLPSLHV